MIMFLMILYSKSNIVTTKTHKLISFNQIDFFVLGSLPTQIGNLTALVDFHLHTNSFSGIHNCYTTVTSIKINIIISITSYDIISQDLYPLKSET